MNRTNAALATALLASGAVILPVIGLEILLLKIIAVLLSSVVCGSVFGYLGLAMGYALKLPERALDRVAVVWVAVGALTGAFTLCYSYLTN